MLVPNAHLAAIAKDKIVRYLLNPEHTRGGSKARVLLSFGYNAAEWGDLADDLRDFHLTSDYSLARESDYGTRYEIRAPLKTPDGRELTVRSIWQIDIGQNKPRFITLFPN